MVVEQAGVVVRSGEFFAVFPAVEEPDFVTVFFSEPFHEFLEIGQYQCARRTWLIREAW